MRKVPLFMPFAGVFAWVCRITKYKKMLCQQEQADFEAEYFVKIAELCKANLHMDESDCKVLLKWRKYEGTGLWKNRNENPSASKSKRLVAG